LLLAGPPAGAVAGAEWAVVVGGGGRRSIWDTIKSVFE